MEINLARQRDQFYTSKELAKESLELLLPFIKSDTPIWLEPSAGEGAFLLALEDKNMSYLALDIEPKYHNVKNGDFFNIDKDYLSNEFKLINKVYAKNDLIVIGNPPFGKNSSLAIKFFNKAAQYSDMIAMILPATFEKLSIQNRLDKSMHLVASFKLSNDLFSFDGKWVSVPTIFQIWEKREGHRDKISKKIESEFFSFVKKEEADFAIQRVGVAAGKVKVDFSLVSPASHYFIKASEEYRKIFENINWSSVKYNTAGNPSISKRELIELFENNLK